MAKKKQKEDDSTLSVHAGERTPPIGDSVVTPIFQTATYSFNKAKEVREYHEMDPKTRFEYGRYGSPTQLTLEKKLGELFKTEDCVATASGMAAVADTLLALLSSGDHLVMTSECYRRTRAFCEKFLVKFGIKVTFAEPNAESVIKAITKKTKAVFLELPTNPHLFVPDVAAVAKVTRKKGIPLLVDPTIAGPFNCDCVELGADIIILSLTKYIAGHNDVIGGAVLGSRANVARVREYHGTAGTLLPPHSAYLVLRGIKTLSMRVERQNKNAQAVAEFLSTHPKVRQVYYPGLPSHPDHEVAVKQMSGFGCVVSFRLKADLAKAEKFCENLKLFRIAPSLGGVESLVELVVTMSFWDRTKKDRAALDLPDDLVRLSLGVEDTADLIKDLERSLKRV